MVNFGEILLFFLNKDGIRNCIPFLTYCRKALVITFGFPHFYVYKKVVHHLSKIINRFLYNYACIKCSLNKLWSINAYSGVLIRFIGLKLKIDITVNIDIAPITYNTEMLRRLKRPHFSRGNVVIKIKTQSCISTLSTLKHQTKNVAQRSDKICRARNNINDKKQIWYLNQIKLNF